MSWSSLQPFVLMRIILKCTKVSVVWGDNLYSLSWFSNDFFLSVFFPFLRPLIKLFKIEISPKDALAFFSNVVNQALEERRKNPGVSVKTYPMSPILSQNKEVLPSLKIWRRCLLGSNSVLEKVISCTDCSLLNTEIRWKRKGQNMPKRNLVKLLMLLVVSSWNKKNMPLEFNDVQWR